MMLSTTNRNRVAPILFCILLAGASPAAGQIGAVLDRMEIVLWPEYDRPSLLVMLRAWLPADAPLPMYVPFPIPAGVEPSAVAKRDATGSLVLAAYSLVDRGPYREIRVLADTYELRIEYYVPMTLEGTRRSYSFQWPGGLSLRSVGYELQQPVGALDLSATPAPDSRDAGFDGLTYLRAALAPAQPTDGFEVSFAYSKNTQELTQALLQARAAPAPETARKPPAEVQSPAIEATGAGRFPWLVVLPVVLLAGLILGWFLHAGSDPDRARGEDEDDR